MSAGSISVPGVGSGLDVNGIVSQLITIEKQKLVPGNQQISTDQAKISALAKISSALSNLHSSIKTLADRNTFTGRSAALNNSDVGSVTTDNTATPGSHNMTVSQLAQAQAIASNGYTDTNTTRLGTGTLTIDLGSHNTTDNTFIRNANTSSVSVTITDQNNTLAGIRDAINAANGAVTASIINDGSQNRLVVTSKNSGIQNSIRIAVADSDGNNTDTTGLSSLSYDPTKAAGSGKNLTQTLAAQDSKLVVDGINITKSSNVISDVLQGVTLSIKQTTTSPVTLTVNADSTATTSAFDAFIKSYNNLASTIKTLTKYDTTTQQGSILTGDTGPQMLLNQVTNALFDNVSGNPGGFNNLTELGITLQADGLLSLNSSTLNTALSDASKSVAEFMTGSMSSSNSLVSVTSSTGLDPGKYAVNIQSTATQGTTVGNKILAANTVITAGVNDNFMLNVKDKSYNVKLTAGTYTQAALLVELSSQINSLVAPTGSSAAVTVSLVDDGNGNKSLKLQDNTYGSKSTITLDSSAAVTDLFGTLTNTTGTNITGTIGGVAATGSGRTLSSGNVTISVNTDSTGLIATLIKTSGLTDNLAAIVTAQTSSSGAINSEIKGLTDDIASQTKRQDELNRQITEKQAALLKEYSALDNTLGELQRIGNQLTAQLTALTNQTNTTNNTTTTTK